MASDAVPMATAVAPVAEAGTGSVGDEADTLP